jgi:hypothetical protein
MIFQLGLCWSMTTSENRYPVFRNMLGAIRSAGAISSTAPEKGGARLYPNRALSRVAAQYSQNSPKNNGKAPIDWQKSAAEMTSFSAFLADLPGMQVNAAEYP